MGRSLLFNALIFPAGTAVATTGNVVSAPVITKRLTAVEAIWFQATSVTGTADIKIEWAGAGEANFSDKAADITFEAYVSLLASSLTGFAGAPEGLNRVAFPAEAGDCAAIRVRLTGVASNPADTLVKAWLILREEPTPG